MVKVRVGYGNSKNIILDFPDKHFIDIVPSDILSKVPRTVSDIHGWVEVKE